MDRLLNVEATSFCNANCSMCPRECVKEFGYISMETVDLLVEKVKNIALFEISLSGRGEPTFHPRLLEIISSLKRLKTTISVVTTSDGLTEKNYRDIVNSLDILRLSVSSIDRTTFKKIHRGLDYDKIWNNIEKLTQYDPHKLHIHLVGGEETYPALEQTVKFFKERGIDNIFLFPLWNRGGAVEEQQIQDIRKKLVEEYGIFYSEDEYLDENKVKQLENPNYCPIGDSSISVNFKGDMIGCFQDFENGTRICNVRDSVDFIKERKKLLKRMPLCMNCNSAQQARR